MPETITPTITKRRKRCDYCKELRDDVLKDGTAGNLCSECESENFVYCSICNDWLPQDDGLHRHLFWTENGYGGSGATDIDPEDWRPDFLEFLALLPEAAIIAIREGIQAGGFNLFFSAGLIGSGCSIEAHGLPMEFYHFHDQFEQDEMTDEQSYGLSWLFTLYETETAEANELTIGWIDEYLASKIRRDTLNIFRQFEMVS